MCYSCLSSFDVSEDYVRCASIRIDYTLSASSRACGLALTMPIDWHVDVLDVPVFAEYLLQMAFVDVFGQLFNHNLGALQYLIVSARASAPASCSSVVALRAEFPRVSAIISTNGASTTRATIAIARTSARRCTRS